MSARWEGAQARRIRRVIVVEGDLVLQTPAHLGNGDADSPIDMPLLRDPRAGGPLLTGASIAGVVRSYLRGLELGELKPTNRDADDGTLGVKLLGGTREDEEGDQSRLIVHDALGTAPTGPELRDGVRIEGGSRTAAHKAKFDFETWPAGTTFPLRFELIVAGEDNETALRRGLASALTGLQDNPAGGGVGARTARGFGRAAVKSWALTTYDLETREGLLAWIGAGQDTTEPLASYTRGPDISSLLASGQVCDARSWFSISASLALDGPLLVAASGAPTVQVGADAVHIRSFRPKANDEAGGDGPVPILPGASLGGVIRGRALRIARTVSGNVAGPSQKLVGDMFGSVSQASRVRLEEHQITRAPHEDLVQNRIRIDRFTGGTSPGALFNEQPVSGESATVQLGLRLINPVPEEIGLLLLVLKDLWTGDLPVGGGASVGRGRLRGNSARMEHREPDGACHRWTVAAGDDGRLQGDDLAGLEDYVAALHRCLGSIEADHTETREASA